MCGIAGLISRDPRSPLILQGMCDALCHRGPDDQGFFMDTEKGVYLGFNRLSVIDLSSRARQPIFNEDKKIIAVVNGEIYNFQELKRELKNAGHVFRSDADSEVVVHAYEEWGEDFVHRINGMFAVALTDKKENKVILARDPVGIKPLYYLKTDELFAFASEAKSFFKIDPTLYQPRLNLKAAEMLLLFPFIPDDSTALEDVRKVPPGSMLIFRNQEIRIKRYWRLENKKEDKPSFGAACGQFEEHINRIVESHLQSDVPVGIFLSGGVDSSFLAAVAVRVSKKPVTAFTAGFDHPLDENAYALSVSRHLGLRHVSLKIRTADTMQKVEHMIGSFDDLSCVDGGLITHYLLAEKIKEAGFKVVLSGEGADEIFGGYPWFSYGQFPYSVLPKEVQNGLLYRRISKNLTHAFTGRGQKTFSGFMNNHSDNKDAFRRISQFEICRQLPNHFLMKLDKATMAHGVETRVPYLDRTMVEFAYHLPDHFKRLPGGLGHKRVLRQVAAKYLPENIAGRRKQGFSLPIKQFLQENEEKIRDYILQSNSLAGQLLPLKQLKSLWDFQGVPILAKEREVLLWKLFIMEVWHSRFFKEAASGVPLHHNIQKANSCCVSV